MAMDGHDECTQKAADAHVLLLPYTTQGHVNPMLQFGKRLAFHGLRATLATSRFLLTTCTPEPSSVHIAAISDGYDRGGFAESGDVDTYLNQFESVGSETLAQLILSESEQGRPVHVLVYDSFLAWAQPVARRLGVAAVAFFTQACALDAVYGHVWTGRLTVPYEKGQPVQLPGLPLVEPDELPSLVVTPGSYPAYLEIVVDQFKGLETADDVLINSFYELEPQEAEHMALTWRAKTIGPTVPSSYVDDDRLRSDTAYGFNLFDLDATPCMSWLDAHPPRSVVFASFGSLSNLPLAQMDEVANGLYNAGKPFLWVVRSSEAHKLPKVFESTCKDTGLVVSWCPQLEVLAHKAIGCFMTHCGWNSILEAIVTAAPMVAMPQWTDQPMNAMYVESVWETGVRARPDGEGLVRREEVERCVREVMDGERKEMFRRNALKWMGKAKEATKEGGSSDRNVVEFVSKYASK